MMTAADLLTAAELGRLGIDPDEHVTLRGAGVSFGHQRVDVLDRDGRLIGRTWDDLLHDEGRRVLGWGRE